MRCYFYRVELKKQKINGATKDYVIPRVENNFYYTLTKKESADSIKRNIKYNKNLTAPLKEGQKIGTVTYLLDGKKIGTLPIRSAETIKKATFPDYLSRTFHKYLFSNVS